MTASASVSNDGAPKHGGASAAEASRTVLQRSVGDPFSSLPHESLRLMMLGCEDNPPYGPNEHTASMFFDLICRSLQKHLLASEDLSTCCYDVSIAIYHVKKQDYPVTKEEWDAYNGILLPGSFSSAYDCDAWIQKLKQIIRDEIHAQARPTLGICFGHQIYAHALDGGEAAKSIMGPQAGRKACVLTEAGHKMLLPDDDSTRQLDFYYTHGDMVLTLPPCAISLGSNDDFPSLVVAYFKSEREAAQCRQGPSSVRPCAITFQAHPEYASNHELGVEKTLCNILMSMEERGDIPSTEKREAMQADALKHYDKVERDSVETMRRVGILLGWFPDPKEKK